MDERRRKLRFRAWRRGFRELDLIMGSYADKHLADLSEADVDEFERLLDLPDWDIYNWISGNQPIPEHQKSSVLDDICAFDYAPQGG